MAAGSALVIGVGAEAGLGAQLAHRFAQEGFRVLVAGRTEARLKSVAKAIREAGGLAEPIAADATREQDVIALFDKAVTRGDLELVVYNVGNNAAVPLLDLTAGDFETFWRQNAFGGFLVGREAVRRMLPKGKGTVLFTGATASSAREASLHRIRLRQSRLARRRARSRTGIRAARDPCCACGDRWCHRRRLCARKISRFRARQGRGWIDRSWRDRRRLSFASSAAEKRLDT